jgi:predicted HTH transcriptional regulator
MIQVTEKEHNNLRSQFVISSWGGDRSFPFAFTEQEVAMLSGVLKSKQAIQIKKVIGKNELSTKSFVGETTEKSSEKSSEKVLRMIQENPMISAQEMADKIKLSSRAVEKSLSKLKNSNIITRIGSAKGGRWELIKKKK